MSSPPLERKADRPAILVTGGAGYIGSHACKALAAAGFLPVAFDNLSNGHAWAVQWGPLVHADLADAAALDASFAAHRPAAVLHFAGLINVGESFADSARYRLNNVDGTRSLLDAMDRANCRTLVFSSSCATYGVPERVPIGEEHPQRPVNPYGENKLEAERLIRARAPAGLRCVALRYFNAAGADAAGTIGEAHSPETHLVPLAIEAALGRSDHIGIFGSDYPTPDGSAIRDYVHVTDLAVVHVLALRHLLAGGAGGAFNVGTGTGYSVREVIAAVEAAVGHPVPRRELPRREGDPPALVADASLVRRVLGWSPASSSLDAIVKTALAWHRDGLPRHR